MPGLGFANFKRIQEIWPTRLNIGIMMFMTCFMAYMLRVNLSITIIAMVNPVNPVENWTSAENYGPRYNWTAHQQSLMLGAFFWGYLITSLPGGMIAEWFGGTKIIGYSMGICSILAVITPFAASFHIWAVVFVRFLTGFLGGSLFPALHNLIAKWSPPDEKGKFISSLMGGTFGTVVTWLGSGFIIEHFGWQWAFFGTGICTGIFLIFWFMIVADTPAKHKRIRQEEKEYIEKSLGDTVSNSKRHLPLKQILLSAPFWALLILHYGSMWGLSFLITAAPKYLNEALGFNLSKTGVLSSLPYVARLLCAFMFGAIGDVVRRRNALSVTKTRKIFCIFSHIIPGSLLIILAFWGTDPYPCVAIMTISLGFNGAATLTNLQNSQDLAPNYAGVLYGMINFVGTTPGFFSPAIVAHFTTGSSTVNNWRYVFVIGACAYIVPAVLFVVFGSGKMQKWNNPEVEDAGE